MDDNNALYLAKGAGISRGSPHFHLGSKREVVVALSLMNDQSGAAALAEAPRWMTERDFYRASPQPAAGRSAVARTGQFQVRRNRATGSESISVLSTWSRTAVTPEEGIGVKVRRIGWLFSCGTCAAALLITSCAAKTDPAQRVGTHGPLAVLEDPAQGESTSLGGTGRLHVTDRCVELELAETGARRLLAWRSAQVEWTSGAIAFTTASGDELTIRTGDSVTVSGEKLTGDEPVERNARWVAEPDGSCTQDVFIVHDVRLVEPR